MHRAGPAAFAVVVGLLLASCGNAGSGPVPTVTAADVPRTTAAPPDVASPDAPGLAAATGDATDAAASPVTAPSGAATATDTAAPSPADDGGSAQASPGEPSADPSPEPSAPTGADADAPDADATPTATAPGETPTPREVAAHVAAEVTAAGAGAQHVVADLDGDGVVEVVVAGVVEDRAGVEVWWWRAGVGFGEPVALDAGPGRAVTDVLVAEITGDADRELLVRIGGGARDSLAVWSIEGPGSVSPRPAVGGCFAGTNVYGATEVRLQARAGGPPAILATCDDTPLPVADWSTAVYEFHDGAFRFVPPLGGDGGPRPALDGGDGARSTDGAGGGGGTGGDTGVGGDTGSG